MEDLTEYLPWISALLLGPIAWLHKQLSRLAQESTEQEASIEATRTWLKNLDAGASRKAELKVLEAHLNALATRLDRAEDTIDRLRNGRH